MAFVEHVRACMHLCVYMCVSLCVCVSLQTVDPLLFDHR